MNARGDILDEVRSTLAEVSGLVPEKIDLSAKLVEDLGLDSIDAIDMAVRIEDRLGFSFKRSELFGVRTVQDIVDLIQAGQRTREESVADTSVAKVE